MDTGINAVFIPWLDYSLKCDTDGHHAVFNSVKAISDFLGYCPDLPLLFGGISDEFPSVTQPNY